MNFFKKKPRVAVALCVAAAVLFSAAPAVFLQAVDAAYFGQLRAVQNPYTAPAPCGDDYYILRQLQARRAAAGTVSQPQDDTGLSHPKIYIDSESNSIRDMRIDYNATPAATALQSLADCGAVPQRWVDAALNWDDSETDRYTDYDGTYWLNNIYYALDSLGIVTYRRYTMQNGALCTAFSLVMDSRTGQVLSVWISALAEDALPAADEPALRSFADQAGLTSLGDWVPRTDWAYTNALYSQNGSAVVAADTNTYTHDDAARQYYSLSISLY